MRPVGLALAGLLLFAACGGSGGGNRAAEVYEINLQGVATAPGKLVLSQPGDIQVDVPEGATAQDVSLLLRGRLQEHKHTVICAVDRGDRGFALLIQGKAEIANGKSNLGGIGGTASQVIQRPEVIESAVRDYLRALRDNSQQALRRTVTDAFYDQAARDLGKGVSLVSVTARSIGCYTASAVAEVQLPGGEHKQDELQLFTDNGQNWQISGIRHLASWADRPSLARK